jgi:hypothetical protein
VKILLRLSLLLEKLAIIAISIEPLQRLCSTFNLKGKSMKKFNHLRSYQMMHSIRVIAVSAIFIAGCASIPPTEQMAVSKVSVSNATSAGGNEFAPLPLKSAMDKMDAAERAMTAKDYVLARQLAEQAQVDAQLAAATARSAKAQKAANALQEDNRVLRQEIERKAQ